MVGVFQCIHSSIPLFIPILKVFFFFIERQSCLLCIARRDKTHDKMSATMKKFTTKQDLNGKIIACDARYGKVFSPPFLYIDLSLEHTSLTDNYHQLLRIVLIILITEIKKTKLTKCQSE